MPSQRRGFTLIELLIVVVIIGILAAIAIPKFGATRTKANESAMKAELRNLMTAQEQYFGDNDEFGAVASLTGAGLWTTPAGYAAADFTFTAAATNWVGTFTKGTRQCDVEVYSSTAVAEEQTANGVIECADVP